MGEVNAILPQGPHIHCGDMPQHDKHPNTTNTVIPNAWCAGVPPLKSFVELVVRVPLGEADGLKDLSHEEMVRNISDEGLVSFVIDGIDTEGSSVTLRVRWGGKDRVYPTKRGTL